MAEQRTVFRSKLIAALLALVGGTVGLHHWYLRRRYAWAVSLAAAGLIFWALLAEPWWDSVAFWILGLFFTVGAVESVYLCLRKDSGFNQKYNAHSSGRSRTGIATVLLAIAATLGGASISMAWLAHVVFRSFHYLGWLEGLNY